MMVVVIVVSPTLHRWMSEILSDPTPDMMVVRFSLHILEELKTRHTMATISQRITILFSLSRLATNFPPILDNMALVFE